MLLIREPDYGDIPTRPGPHCDIGVGAFELRNYGARLVGCRRCQGFWSRSNSSGQTADLMRCDFSGMTAGSDKVARERSGYNERKQCSYRTRRNQSCASAKTLANVREPPSDTCVQGGAQMFDSDLNGLCETIQRRFRSAIPQQPAQGRDGRQVLFAICAVSEMASDLLHLMRLEFAVLESAQKRAYLAA
jgi:hypothetical protein